MLTLICQSADEHDEGEARLCYILGQHRRMRASTAQSTVNDLALGPR